MKLKAIGQVALTVEDLGRAVGFYRDLLGLDFLFQANSVAFFECGGMRLMLGQSESPGEKAGGTILYYRVDDLNECFETLRQRGVDVVREPHLVARLADHELWLAFLHDPDGNIFGLMCEKRPTGGEGDHAQG